MSILPHSASSGKKWAVLALTAAAVLILTFLAVQKNSSQNALQGKLALQKNNQLIPRGPLVKPGSIDVSLPNVLAPNQTVPAGTPYVLAARFKVKASTEDFAIRKLSVRIAHPTTNRDITSVIARFPTDLLNPTFLDGRAHTEVVRPNQSGQYDTYDLTGGDLNFKVGKNRDDVTYEVYLDISPHAVSQDVIQLYFGGDLSFLFEAVGLTSGVVKTYANIGTFVPNPTQITIR